MINREHKADHKAAGILMLACVLLSILGSDPTENLLHRVILYASLLSSWDIVFNLMIRVFILKK